MQQQRHRAKLAVAAAELVASNTVVLASPFVSGGPTVCVCVYAIADFFLLLFVKFLIVEAKESGRSVIVDCLNKRAG